jgi:hypothetical protein
MRRAVSWGLTIGSGFLFALWVWMGGHLLAGRASFGGGGQPVEIVSFLTIGAVSGFGLFAGVRTLFAHRVVEQPEIENARRDGANRSGRLIGKVLFAFGGAGLYTLGEARAQTESFNGLMFIGYGAIFCLAAGGACLFAFRKRSE